MHNNDVGNAPPQVAFMHKKRKKPEHHRNGGGDIGVDLLKDSKKAEIHKNQTSKPSLIPPDRLLIPAKTSRDQPLVAYEIDSDDDFSHPSQSLMSSHREREKTKFPQHSSMAAADTDHQDVVDLHSIDDDDEEAADLDLIQPKTSSLGRGICNKMYLCSIQ